MKTFTFLPILILITVKSLSQSSDVNRNLTWRIGDPYINNQRGNTVISFKSTPPAVSIGQNSYGFSQNSSAVCDTSGNELLVTNGIKTLDKNMQPVLNCDTFIRGNYILGSGIYGMAIPQTSLILPQPGNDSMYYIFHTDANDKLEPPCFIYGQYISNQYRIIYGKLYCTIININRINHLG